MKRNKIKKNIKNKSNDVTLVNINKVNNNKINNNISIKNNNSNNNIKVSLSTNPIIPNNKKTNKMHSLSTDNYTLKDTNDLCLYLTNIPSIKDIKKTIDEYYTKNGLFKQKVPSSSF